MAQRQHWPTHKVECQKHSLALKSNATSAAVAAAYVHKGVPLSDRLLSLLETPIGATSLLEGLLHQREGEPLNMMVRKRACSCLGLSVLSFHVNVHFFLL